MVNLLAFFGLFLVILVTPRGLVLPEVSSSFSFPLSPCVCSFFFSQVSAFVFMLLPMFGGAGGRLSFQLMLTCFKAAVPKLLMSDDIFTDWSLRCRG